MGERVMAESLAQPSAGSIIVEPSDGGYTRLKAAAIKPPPSRLKVAGGDALV
jgi:hypothetical protein